uniref:Uncharacterized protein n=1 Tax=Arion vulgaris TaxID=1028688 RepID=A0A0B7BSW3_9EUPU
MSTPELIASEKTQSQQSPNAHNKLYKSSSGVRLDNITNVANSRIQKFSFCV